ncbi:MAG: PhzF family phenazine biosynthesis protein [Acidimicrobiales bacterium]|nr:PhzF family phenazine biosynthesis protein [Acidimicrobiales bacterium]
MAHPLHIVDAFTDHPFAGNPAGVVQLDEAAEAEWMQAVAAELNLADTAFLVPRADGDHDLRWFTPAKEVDLCGHATLASAHVLGGTRRFHTRVGELICTPDDDGRIAMDLPTHPTEPAPHDGWGPILGLDDRQICSARASADWDLIEVADAAAVEAAESRREPLLTRRGHAIVVADTTGADGDIDTVCRVFAPSAGIDEDPVTGSAHTVIGPWIAERTGRTAFRCRQASARGGLLDLEVAGDRVVLRGRAVTVISGELRA